MIARIDDGDYRLAVASARDKVATQQATVERFERQIVAQRAAVEQAKAQLASANAAQIRAQAEYDRQQALAGKAFASKQTLEQAVAGRDQAVAAVRSAEAAVEGAIAKSACCRRKSGRRSGTLAELRTALAKAERDLSFHRDQGAGRWRGRQPRGAGRRLSSKPASASPRWCHCRTYIIDANFKETQLARLHPGQPVSIKVDALPDRTIHGVVASIAPASGAVFSLLPPDNATGNFTKIVQRLAVRIRVPAAVADRGVLRPGMSVVVDINTKPGAVAAIAPQIRTATKLGRRFRHE